MSSLSFPLVPGCSAETSLSLSTDGPISAARWAEARDYDAANPLPRPFATRIGRITLKPAAIVAIIAAAVRKAALRGQSITRTDLTDLGLSGAEVDRHFAAGLNLALAREPRLAQLAEEA